MYYMIFGKDSKYESEKKMFFFPMTDNITMNIFCPK